MSDSPYTSLPANAVSPGFYRGVVLKHLRNGMCKIWVPGVFAAELSSYENADMLPSAEQASPLAFGANNGLGVFSYPSIGSVVWCFFANNDQNYPVYFAATLGGPKAYDDGKGSENTATADNSWKKAYVKPGSYPNDAYAHVIAVKNSEVLVYETGEIDISTKNDDGSRTCKVVLDSRGNITVDSSAKIIMHSNSISLSSDQQIDLKAPYINIYGDVKTEVMSKAINLDGRAGHVRAIGPQGGKTLA